VRHCPRRWAPPLPSKVLDDRRHRLLVWTAEDGSVANTIYLAPSAHSEAVEVITSDGGLVLRIPVVRQQSVLRGVIHVPENEGRVESDVLPSFAFPIGLQAVDHGLCRGGNVLCTSFLTGISVRLGGIADRELVVCGSGSCHWPEQAARQHDPRRIAVGESPHSQ
jgi:hypothetical protein